ncbi:MAG TPA: branched-chain amino acid ABC transporter permease [Methylomirabilota bacterium]|nr:branched-chain amino acid ABC transporter permease [Methylomirabilota bacterium]
MATLLQQLINGLTVGSLYALMALGLTMVYGVMRVLHIAHAGVFTFGAYAGLWALTWSGSFWVALAAAMAAAMLLGLAMEHWVYSPLLRKPPITTLIASIGVFIALEEIYRIVAGPEPYAFQVRLVLPDVRVGGLLLTAPQLLVALVTGALLLGLWLLLSRTGIGLAIRAVSQDGEIAAACGMNPRRAVALTFAIGSALAGAAGMLVGVFYNSVSPTMGSVTAYKGLAIIVLGGLGSIPGTVLGGLVVGVVETLVIGLVDFPLPRDAWAFLAMIAVFLARPQGLLGVR